MLLPTQSLISPEEVGEVDDDFFTNDLVLLRTPPPQVPRVDNDFIVNELVLLRTPSQLVERVDDDFDQNDFVLLRTPPFQLVQADDDFTLNELALLRTPPGNRNYVNSKELVEGLCSSCLKNIKNVHFYMRKAKIFQNNVISYKERLILLKRN